MSISLDELEALAKAASSGMSRGPWFLEHQIGIHGSPTTGPERQFIAACDPATILKLLAVVRAAKELQALCGTAKSADDFISMRFRLRKSISALDTP